MESFFIFSQNEHTQEDMLFSKFAPRCELYPIAQVWVLQHAPRAYEVRKNGTAATSSSAGSSWLSHR